MLWGGWSEAGSVWLCKRGCASKGALTEVLNPGGWGHPIAVFVGQERGARLGSMLVRIILNLILRSAADYPLLYLF